MLERRTDMRTFTVCMRIPNTDDETGRENKRCSVDEELWETYCWRLWGHVRIKTFSKTWALKYHTGMLAHKTTIKIWFVKFLARVNKYFWNPLDEGELTGRNKRYGIGLSSLHRYLALVWLSSVLEGVLQGSQPRESPEKHHSIWWGWKYRSQS